MSHDPGSLVLERFVQEKRLLGSFNLRVFFTATRELRLDRKSQGQSGLRLCWPQGLAHGMSQHIQMNTTTTTTTTTTTKRVPGGLVADPS